MVPSSSCSPSSNNSLMRLADTIHECSCGGKNFQLCQVSEIFFSFHIFVFLFLLMALESTYYTLILCCGVINRQYHLTRKIFVCKLFRNEFSISMPCSHSHKHTVDAKKRSLVNILILFHCQLTDVSTVQHFCNG